MKKIMLVAALALFVSGCASNRQPVEPEWLDGTSDRYPQTRYLSGLGQADSAAVARDRARADLAKVFEVRIAEASRDSSSAMRRSNGTGGLEQETESRFERQIDVQAEQVLVGVKVVDVWRDKSGQHHAFAVLDRFKTAERLRNEIADLDAQTERSVADARASGDLLLRIDAAAKAAEAQRAREQVQRYLQVVDITGQGVPSRFKAARLESDYQQLARRLRVNTAAEEDPLGNLATLLSGGVSQAGFSNAASNDANYSLVGSLKLDESLVGGWHWAKGMLELKLVDKSGNVRSVNQWPIKASAQQPGVARQRLAEKIQRVLSERLREALLQR